MLEKCSAVTRDGKPCSARPRPNSDRCPWHDERLSAQRRAWSAKGGAGKSNAARAAKAMPTAMTSAELLATLSQAIRKVERGEMQPGPAGAIAALARTMNAIRETSEIERRLAALEAAAGVAPRRTA